MRGSRPFPAEDELGRPDRDAVAVGELRPLRPLPVHVEAVRGAEIDEPEGIALAPELRVAPRRVRVGDLDVALLRPPDHEAVPLELVRAPVDRQARPRRLDPQL